MAFLEVSEQVLLMPTLEIQLWWNEEEGIPRELWVLLTQDQ
jgi:hypothetical protein